MRTSTRSGSAELAEAVGQAARELAGKVRRMIITRASGAIWQVAGHLLLDGTTETRDAEMFGGIGFASRPAAEGDVEALVAFPPEGGKPQIIAARQEGVRKSVADDLPADSAQMHNSATIVRVAEGVVEIRSSAGAAQKLVRGETYRAAEDNLLTALGTFATAIGALDPLTAAASAVTLNAAIVAFKAAAATYLTTVAKAE